MSREMRRFNLIQLKKTSVMQEVVNIKTTMRRQDQALKYFLYNSKGVKMLFLSSLTTVRMFSLLEEV